MYYSYKTRKTQKQEETLKLSFIDTAKQKITDILPDSYTRKQSHNSNDVIHSKNDNAYTYLSLFDRQTDNLHYKDYKLIFKDTQVRVGWAILKYFLMSKNYNITSNSDSPEDIEIADFITDCLDNMSIPFRDVVKNILTAIPYSYSVQEKVYTVRDGKIVIDSLYPIHRKTIDLNPWVRDNQGNLTHVYQKTSYGSEYIPANKCVIYSFEKEFDELEGNSILNELKPVCEDKDQVKDWLMTYANRLGSPVMYGKTDDENHAENMLNSFDDVADGTTGLVVGQTDEIGVIETSSKGEIYFSLLQYLDNQIFRSFFIGNLLLGDTSQTGSYAQINGQQDFMLYIMNGILTDVAQCLQQVINELVIYNYGREAKSPNISFENFIAKDILSLMNALKGFIDNGSFDSDNRGFKELLAKAFMSEADIKLDLDTVTDTTQALEDETNYNYQEPLTDTPEAQQIVDNVLEGII